MVVLRFNGVRWWGRMIVRWNRSLIGGKASFRVEAQDTSRLIRSIGLHHLPPLGGEEPCPAVAVSDA